ncbi:MAG: sarcosine oxidase subunit alpha family protein [Rhizobiales bacterium]|nr:sarcosine oxidase subunit alpha family protein [Hyphomicrobiales bacterium]NRB15387.1 sarcosine oxidase subunit alpha family protein [Hyphomicrobiales bacterium]
MARKIKHVFNRRLDIASQVNLEKPIDFYFDGKKYSGFEGDSLASALIANGVNIVGRSFKYHRPRGIMSAGAEEANAIVQLGKEPHVQPNMLATNVELYHGLVAKSVNAWPNAAFDIFAILNLAKPFFVAGFYYKVFKWPSWKFWSPLVRRLAGLGTVPKQPDPDDYDYHHAHTDILIVGAGIAGLMAALAHGKAGKKVLVVEQQNQLGGALLFEKIKIDGISALAKIAEIEAELTAMDNVTIVKRATAIGYYDDNFITISERLRHHIAPQLNSSKPRERFWHLRAKQVIIATGAIERPLVFANNDRPNIMLANAVRHYANRFGVVAAKRIFLATNNDDAYRSALDLHALGLHIVGIADVRTNPQGDLVAAVRKLGITIYAGHAIVDTSGARAVNSVSIAAINVADNHLDERQRRFNCNLVATSGGWSPVVHLHSQSGGKLRFDDGIQAFVPHKYVQNNLCIGAANGVFELGDIFAEAQQNYGIMPPKINPVLTEPILALWDLPPNIKKIRTSKRWVDLLHDVTATDVILAARENYVSVEHFKRYTTTGMALDQGKTSNVNALAILGRATGRDIPEVGTTKFRPPYSPVTLGAMAGRDNGILFSPLRDLPMHNWHADNGAEFEDYGGWNRPAYYAKSKETERQAVDREINAVRQHVGILDYSPLGKIMVQGPDAAGFLDYFYCNNVSNLKPMRARYGLMLNEDGNVIDDGVFVRLAADKYMVTTTSGGAVRFAATLEEWRQCEWPDMNVVITNITTGWACISLQGPKARKLLQKIDLSVDLAAAEFGHMEMRIGSINGVEIKIMRTSFTGELGFEIYMPRSYANAIWQMLVKAGQEFGLEPFGLEALMAMRTEKGFIHIGVDTDSTTIPGDVGFGVPAAKKKVNYIGKRSLLRPESVRKDREILVGLKVVGAASLTPGGIILASGYDNAPAPMDGRVTSSYNSPTMGHAVALGMLKDGHNRMGEIVKIYDLAGMSQAEVVKPCFFDPQGERLNV